MTTLRKRQLEMTRDLIAETARRLFMERGFDAVTVAEIAREAGVSEKTVFNHFQTKEDLFYGRMEAFEQELVGAVRARRSGESMLQAFVAFASRARGMLADDDEGAGERLYALQRLIADSPALLARERRIYAGYTDALAQVIADETGARAGDIAPWVAANAMIGVHRALVDWVRAEVLAGERDTKRLTRGMRAQARRAQRVLEGGLV
jgi:AcrR family transcriptional regulator